ncbi:MAG: VIT1/CCC1 transporter family protein [candidate division Zixibacteria bacterium]|nr:VIT1/CCC1 transporter family protein [candidate division Zixibacteria bacterium]MCI0595947.1 VIT1/CCC1 transporter family protein [candidate division Zixibacteria bacterium]
MSSKGENRDKAPQELAKRYLANLQDETNSAYLYRVLADAESHPQVAEVYRRLAKVEEEHAKFWQEKLQSAGCSIGIIKPGWRPKVLGWLARRFGPQVVIPTITAMERTGGTDYDAQPESRGTKLPRQERSHARVLKSIAAASPQGLEGSALARLEGRHRATGGNALRAAVLGANDGLVSNLSLVMGVAGAELSGQTILITGLAGLLAGAGSMAMGEWLSVQSSRELFAHQIAIEKRELEEIPEEEKEELALIYQAKGLSEAQARELAEHILSDKATALDTLAREELGIEPKELGGSAWEAAAMSFVLFAVGAIIPVLPFLFSFGFNAAWASLAASAIGLFVIGAAITLFTGRGLFYSGFRQVFFGLAAAALTFGIGRLIGVTVAG